MPYLPLLSVSSVLDIHPELLTTPSFAPFGTAIISPLPSSQASIPTSAPPPPPLHPAHQPDPVIANQSTAFKYSPISPLTSNYVPSTNPKPQMSMFSCFPRGRLGHGNRFEVKILERHPFTTQTFCPLGLASESAETYFLVIVAPSMDNPVETEEGGGLVERPPDLNKLRAFVAHGGQAVTYAPGTWHAPMVVLGERRVDFVVTQFVNGVSQDDCQEVRIGEGVGVLVGARKGKEETKAKL
jgi:ureidoglycolate lyase